MVPTTESLIGSRDRETNNLYSDLVTSEEFLGSHVLRIPVPTGSSNGKDGPNVRDSRGKAKQVTTVNGRTVIIKENSVYSNKGEVGVAIPCLTCADTGFRFQNLGTGSTSDGCPVLYSQQ